MEISDIVLLVLLIGPAVWVSRDLIPYMWRSMLSRPTTLALTLGGVSLVSFVFAAVLMLSKGIEETMVETGSADNVIVTRKAAQAELQSQIDRDAVNIIKSQPEIARTSDGRQLASADIFILINLKKKTSGDMGNITVRGVEPASMDLRTKVRLGEGRMLTFGTPEVIVGRNIAERFADVEIGKQLEFGGGLWTIVGVFDAGGSGFESEIWGDVDQIMAAFNRPVYSSLTFRLQDAGSFEALKTRLEADRRINYLDYFREQAYYAKQSELMANFIKILGMMVTIIFSLGACIGAAITMYAAVANRTPEIGTLRALGFRRRKILGMFLLESVVISVLGSAIGLVGASFLELLVISTTNFATFTELAFGFEMTPGIVMSTVIFALFMGLVGGFSPAARAARLKIVSALRSA
jgi:ABC-type lipoprotein release transport system permease subunit